MVTAGSSGLHEYLTARKRKRDSMRCITDARPRCTMAAGSFSFSMDFRRGLRGLTPGACISHCAATFTALKRWTTGSRKVEYHRECHAPPGARHLGLDRAGPKAPCRHSAHHRALSGGLCPWKLRRERPSSRHNGACKQGPAEGSSEGLHEECASYMVPDLSILTPCKER